MQNRCGCVVNRLEAEAVSQAMFEGRTISRLFHDLTRRCIDGSCTCSITNTLQSSILSLDTGLVRFAPLLADCPDKECARQFRPVAIDADLHLNSHRITLFERCIRSHVESAICQCSSWASHDMNMGLYMMSIRGSIARTQ